MSARNHPRIVGAFVLGAVAIVLAAIVLLSSGGWFKPRDRFSIYFPGSVKGLSQGSAITFRGIKIGEVTDVREGVTLASGGRAAAMPSFPQDEISRLFTEA